MMHADHYDHQEVRPARATAVHVRTHACMPSQSFYSTSVPQQLPPLEQLFSDDGNLFAQFLRDIFGHDGGNAGSTGGWMSRHAGVPHVPSNPIAGLSTWYADAALGGASAAANGTLASAPPPVSLLKPDGARLVELLVTGAVRRGTATSGIAGTHFGGAAAITHDAYGGGGPALGDAGGGFPTAHGDAVGGYSLLQHVTGCCRAAGLALGGATFPLHATFLPMRTQLLISGDEHGYHRYATDNAQLYLRLLRHTFGTAAAARRAAVVAAAGGGGPGSGGGMGDGMAAAAAVGTAGGGGSYGAMAGPHLELSMLEYLLFVIARHPVLAPALPRCSGASARGGYDGLRSGAESLDLRRVLGLGGGAAARAQNDGGARLADRRLARFGVPALLCGAPFNAFLLDCCCELFPHSAAVSGLALGCAMSRAPPHAANDAWAHHAHGGLVAMAAARCAPLTPEAELALRVFVEIWLERNTLLASDSAFRGNLVLPDATHAADGYHAPSPATLEALIVLLTHLSADPALEEVATYASYYGIPGDTRSGIAPGARGVGGIPRGGRTSAASHVATPALELLHAPLARFLGLTFIATGRSAAAGSALGGGALGGGAGARAGSSEPLEIFALATRLWLVVLAPWRAADALRGHREPPEALLRAASGRSESAGSGMPSPQHSRTGGGIGGGIGTREVFGGTARWTGDGAVRTATLPGYQDFWAEYVRGGLEMYTTTALAFVIGTNELIRASTAPELLATAPCAGMGKVTPVDDVEPASVSLLVELLEAVFVDVFCPPLLQSIGFWPERAAQEHALDLLRTLHTVRAARDRRTAARVAARAGGGALGIAATRLRRAAVGAFGNVASSGAAGSGAAADESVSGAPFVQQQALSSEQRRLQAEGEQLITQILNVQLGICNVFGLDPQYAEAPPPTEPSQHTLDTTGTGAAAATVKPQRAAAECDTLGARRRQQWSRARAQDVRYIGDVSRRPICSYESAWAVRALAKAAIALEHHGAPPTLLGTPIANSLRVLADQRLWLWVAAGVLVLYCRS